MKIFSVSYKVSVYCAVNINKYKTTPLGGWGGFMNSQQLQSFELKLGEIYNKTEWIQYEIDLTGFVALFPIEFKKGRPQRPDMPEHFDLDRNTRLAIMVAFREAFS
jgi:hypothetical protein